MNSMVDRELLGLYYVYKMTNCNRFSDCAYTER